MNSETTAKDVMSSAKNLLQYSRELNILYVEDDDTLRNEMVFLFQPLFKSIDTAEHGEAALEKYHNSTYDLVLTDINMPRMNGIELIGKIREINTEQKIMAISAHSESDILLDVIKSGVNGFLLKPINQHEAMLALYPVCRDAYAQNLNIELVEELNREKQKLEEQNRELQMQINATKTKHQQVEALIQPNKKVKQSDEIEAYFAKDEDEGDENVLLLSDHCDDLLEIFHDISSLCTACANQPDQQSVQRIASGFAKAAGILGNYAPYLDSLVAAMNELSGTLNTRSEEFLNALSTNSESLLMLFDAVSSDMENYVERFQHESIAMRNAHHIHEPTALSIQQIIAIVSSEEMDYGELEFFI